MKTFNIKEKLIYGKFLKPLIYLLIFVWAFFLLWLIPTFFYHYEGNWREKIQEKIQLKNQ